MIENIKNCEDFESLRLQREAGTLIECLDQGFVRYVDHMGDDAAIVQAARVSYGDGTKKVLKDRELIRYLMRHWHTTPFEMVEFKFHIRITMDAWRQMIRHRTASVNEYSTRYSQAINGVQETEPDEWRLQAGNNKQGSMGLLTNWPPHMAGFASYGNYDSPGDYLSSNERELQAFARKVYDERLEFGVAREQARKDLPLCNYTEAYWKIDLHNLFHFLRLRMDSHAQLEIREYANAIAKLIQPHVPLAHEAFEIYRLNSMSLSALEIEAMRSMFSGSNPDHPDMTKRERAEFADKLAELGYVEATI